MNVILLLKDKSSVEYCVDTNTLRQGLEKLQAHGYTAIPVISAEGVYVGSVSEGDFLWDILNRGETDLKAQENHLIRDIIRKDWNPAVRVSVSMDELLERVVNQNFVPVVDDRDVFIGIVTRKDVITWFIEEASHAQDVACRQRCDEK